MGQGTSKRKTTAKAGEQQGGGENGTAVTPAATANQPQQEKSADTPQQEAAATDKGDVGGEGEAAEKHGEGRKQNGEAQEDPNTSTVSNGDSSHGGVVKRRHKKEPAKSGQAAPASIAPNGSANTRKRISFYETVDASEVLPYLVIGNLPSAKDDDFLSRKNVKYVLNLTSEPNEHEAEGVEYKSVLLEDDEDVELAPYLEECFEFINKAKASCTKKQTTVALVHSYYGISRTSAITLAYLMKERHWTLKEAYDHLKERHPSAKPNDGFVIQLLRYDQELHDGRMSMTLKDFYQQP